MDRLEAEQIQLKAKVENLEKGKIEQDAEIDQLKKINQQLKTAQIADLSNKKETRSMKDLNTIINESIQPGEYNTIIHQIIKMMTYFVVYIQKRKGQRNLFKETISLLDEPLFRRAAAISPLWATPSTVFIKFNRPIISKKLAPCSAILTASSESQVKYFCSKHPLAVNCRCFI